MEKTNLHNAHTRALKRFPIKYQKIGTFTKIQAIKDLKKFVALCRKNKVKEKSFHLYFDGKKWVPVADSVKHLYSHLKHIVEVKL